MFLRNPFYDNVSGSCEPSVNDGVKVTVVYGTHYGVNKLLRHETRHAIKMLSNDTVDKDVENPCRWTTAAMLGPLVVGDAVSCFSGERAPGLIGSILTLGMAVKQIVKSRRESRIEEDDADLDMYDKRLAKKYPIIYITKQNP